MCTEGTWETSWVRMKSVDRPIGARCCGRTSGSSTLCPTRRWTFPRVTSRYRGSKTWWPSRDKSLSIPLSRCAKKVNALTSSSRTLRSPTNRWRSSSSTCTRNLRSSLRPWQGSQLNSLHFQSYTQQPRGTPRTITTLKTSTVRVQVTSLVRVNVCRMRRNSSVTLSRRWPTNMEMRPRIH